MKPEVAHELSPEQVMKRLPVRYRGKAEGTPLRAERYHLLVFASAKDEVVLSGPVKRALARLPLDGADIVVAAPGFTAEALELLRTRGATIYTLGDFHWTDATFQEGRQATRLPREQA